MKKKVPNLSIGVTEVAETENSLDTRFLSRSPMIDIVRGVEDGGDMFFPLDLGTFFFFGSF